MPKIERKNETPDNLRPFIFHGVDLSWKEGAKEALAECPFCNRGGKFSVNIGSGMFRCLVCDEKGNAYTFIRLLHDRSDASTNDYESLSNSRGLINPDALMYWGVCRSIVTDSWMIPGYGIDGKLNQLYVYRLVDGKLRWLPTPTLGHQIHRQATYDKDKSTVYLCEGPGDALILWELLGLAKEFGGELVPTSNIAVSLLADANVLAVPGCNVFHDTWYSFFSGKRVVILFDSDHPKTHNKTGKAIPPAGYEGVKRIVETLAKSKAPPESISYLRWGPDGYDLSLPSGYDLKDALMSPGTQLASRLAALESLRGRFVEIDPETFLGKKIPKSGKASTNGKPAEGDGLELLPCDSYRELVTAWRKAMKWTDGLDHALSAMLSSVISTMTVGDQLWLKIIGPASCGKSTLCEAISSNSQYVLAKSTIRGFHSGFSSDGEEDNSLISKVAGKTLVTKDGDTLLQSPNLGQILSEARDVYDTVSRTSYRNRASKDYNGIRMTWLLCGTSSLRSLDASELGERFLDCVIMEGIDDELEDEILVRVANRAKRNMAIEASSDLTTQQDPEMTRVMQLTGGYIDYLRGNATELLGGVAMPDQTIRLCTRLGKFVAYMRARPSTRQDETAEREFAARLVSQHVRLANCLAAVLNKSSIDDAVMNRVTKIALDTSRGYTLQICDFLYRAYEDDGGGLEPKTLAMYLNTTEAKIRDLLRFLKQINVLEAYSTKIKGLAAKPRWRLTERFALLYQEVHNHSTKALD